MSEKSHIYFASDLHLGAPSPEESLVREKHFVRWLDHIKHHAAKLFLVGDLFDFWFEYKHAVPRGYVRMLGKLAELSDAGTEIHVFTGNHDHWFQSYLTEQIGATIYREPQLMTFFGRKYYIAHGDGLGPGDHGYKLLKKVVTAPLSRWLYARLHPNSGIGLALWVSSRGGNHDYRDHGEVDHLGEQEFLYQHANQVYSQQPDIDCFIFGHRHMLIDDVRENGLHVVILGDWIQYFSYLQVHEAGEELCAFPFPSSGGA
ncbi:MAG: UDP-2,3-diacylglucosamine diphosphatase [Bacteroidota bacterium]